jgi:uncharacterized protein YebE (UPF0316 family)
MLMYLVIFLAKIVEVALMTVRIVLITKGERLIGAIIGFFEVVIWIVVVGNVIADITSDPLKAVAYSLGFAVGNYVGSLLEEKIGIGMSEVQAIVLKEHGKSLADAIRETGFAVTVVEGQGKNFPRNILFMYIRRRRVNELIDTINKNQQNVVITVSEAKPIYGGFKMLRK